MSLTPESRDQQRAVFDNCINIYEDRTFVRGELWSKFDAADALHNCQSKVARAEAAVDLQAATEGERETALKEEAIDSLYDLINYAAFAIRHLTGETPHA